MKICDRCKKQTDILAPFEIARKTFGVFGSAIQQFNVEVCSDCHEEGKEILDSLGRALDGAQREIMIEARDAWLKTPVKFTKPCTLPPGLPQITDDGRAWIKAFKARFVAMFKKKVEAPSE
jgi:hypothetical protein